MLPMVIVPAQGEVLPYPDPAEREARGPAACMARQISINATLAGGDRWFESISLQRRVRLSPGAAFEGRKPRLSARVCAAGLASKS
jgi:hypothetical protein